MIRTAFEMKYKYLLKNIEEKMLESYQGFIDMTLCNHEVEDYLKSKGYSLQEVRYERIDGVYGFHGRLTGDGEIKMRISWE
jgi:hypothetical protein